MIILGNSFEIRPVIDISIIDIKVLYIKTCCMGSHFDDSSHSLVNERQSYIGLTMTLTFQSPWFMVVICLICLM